MGLRGLGEQSAAVVPALQDQVMPRGKNFPEAANLAREMIGAS